MGNYVIVFKENNGLRIGLKRYTEQAARKRIKQLSLVGIHNVKPMTFEQALGIN